MDNSPQQFHLVLDPFPALEGQPRALPSGAAPADRLEVPAGISYLEALPGERPRLVGQPERGADAFVLEPVSRPRQPRLVLLSPPGRRARVNGQLAPRLAVLGVKDQVQLNDDYLLHVTLYNRPWIGPPPANVPGKTCPICRAPFTEATTVYVCPACATPVHCEGEDRGADRLECVRLGPDCPVCGAPVVLAHGYSFFPELYRG